MINKPALTTQAIHELLAQRWSPRAFNSEQTISNSEILSLLEAARWAPSCMNEQPWRFIVCAKTQDETAWQSLLACLGEKNQLWAQHAPLLILAMSVNNFTQSAKPNRWAGYDTGAACMSLCLQASALGLVAHQIGGFDAEHCREVFAIPSDNTPMTVIAIGYQDEADQLNDELRQKELAPRSRYEHEQFVQFGLPKGQEQH